MASRSESDDEQMMTSQSQQHESRMDLGETNHGRLSVVLCHECQTLHYELKCNTSSMLSARKGIEEGPCRNSITWDEFFGSSLDLAPSLLSIYDNLAASNENDDTDNNDTSISDPHNHHQHPDHVGGFAGLGATHSCVTSADSLGFWVTDRDSRQRLWVRSCHVTGSGSPRPVSLLMMEPLRDGAGLDRDKVKKRPLSISSLSSVSSASLPRPQHKRPNLCQDGGEETSSDFASQTSSDSNLAVSLTSDRVSLTSDRVSLTSDPVSSLTSEAVSDRVSMTSTDDSSTASLTAPGNLSGQDESSVDPQCFDCRTQPLGRPALRLDTSCGGGGGGSGRGGLLEPPSPSGKSSTSLSSPTSSSSSLCTSPSLQQQQNSLAMAVAHANANHNDNTNTNSNSTLPMEASSSVERGLGKKQQAVVMKPLQTSVRPVIISLPDSIRKPRRSSSGVDREMGAGGAVSQGEGSDYRRTSGSSGTLTPLSHTSSSTNGGENLLPPSLSSRGNAGALCHSASAPSPLRSVLLTSPESVGASGTPVGGARGSLCDASSPAVSSSLSAPSVSRSSSTGGIQSSPLPMQVHSLSHHHSCSSPLSPTAIARRRFLASHFDIPDVPPLEESAIDSEAHDSSMEVSEDHGVRAIDSASVSSSANAETNSENRHANDSAVCASEERGQGSSSLAVPSSLSLRSKTETSPTSSPSSIGSPGSALHSPCKECSGEARDKQEYSCPHRSNKSSSSSPTQHSHSADSPMTSSPTRIRSHSKKHDGGVPGRGGSMKGSAGSVKGGSYVTYVQRVVMEIVDTERMYCDSLEAIIKGYLEPLKKLLGDAESAREDLSCLFCNITDIYEFGKIFLADLEKCGLDPVKVAECFVKHNNGFVIYTDYCTNYPRAVEVLTRFMQDTELSEVCKECQQSLGHGLPLGAYLLRPVQRVLKYHLLLQNILKNFDKNKTGYNTLEQALLHMTAMAHHINEMKRRHEHAVRIQEVQSQLEDYSGEDLTRLGELVLEGSFRVYGAKASRQVFLFEKGILITKKKEGGMLTCKACVPCSNLMLVEVIPNEPLSFHIIPFDNPRAQHTLQARSMEQKRRWCQEIKRLLLESYKGRIPDNVKSLVMELGRNHDNDYVGKDTHDSPWKNQHTAPEYLEKRRHRRKSGGKGSDFGPLLKLPRPKRDQSAGKNNKSPKAWRKSDSKLLSENRERAGSLPMMLADVSSASLPGIAASVALTPPDSLSRQTSNTSQKSTTSQQTPTRADGNNNQSKKASESPEKSAECTAFASPASDEESKALQRRAASFKRAVRMQPLFSQDLCDEDFPVTNDVAGAQRNSDDSQTSRADTRLSQNGHSRSNGGGTNANYTQSSSASNSEGSSDSDGGEERKLKAGKDAKTSKANMYSSMPALNSLERRPAQKRRPGVTKTGLRAKKDLSISSDALADNADPTAEASSSRQYRRRWEGADDGMQRKVPALHDAYGRRSRENLLRKKGKVVSGAKLTNWGSVDKLTKGSMSDLSHLEDDPWEKKSNSPITSPRSRDAPIILTPTPSTNTYSRSNSMSQSTDWSPGLLTPGQGRPRNLSDVTEVARRPGKENMDWMVYLNRMSDDQVMRERASSFSQVTGRLRSSSNDVMPKALRDSNTNISRSSSLCQDTLKRYSLDLDRRKLSGEGDVPSSASLREGTSKSDRSSVIPTPKDQREERLSPPESGDVEMTDVGRLRSSSSPPTALSGAFNNTSGPASNLEASSPPLSPYGASGGSMEASSFVPKPKPRSTVQQRLSPTPVSPRPESNAQHTATAYSTTPQDLPSPKADYLLPQRQAEQPPSPRHRQQRPLSPQTAALSAEGEKLVAEMERYYEANSPRTPTLAFKFPASPHTLDLAQADSQAYEEGDSSSATSPGNQTNSLSPNNQASINRLSGVSSVSSASNDSYTAGHHYHRNPPREVNPNRLSGVSSISTSSYDSQNSNSSDSMVGTLKTKISALTHKLGGKRSKEEEQGHSHSHHHHHHHHLPFLGSREGLASPPNPKAELREVLREHALGSQHIGSRMANTLPVGFEPLLSPAESPPDQALSSYEYSSKESTPEPHSRFSFPSAVSKNDKAASEALQASGPVQQSDSGICMHSEESGDNRLHRFQKSNTLPADLSPRQYLADGDALDNESKKRRGSASSTVSVDSFYERRLSVAFEFQDQGVFADMQSEAEAKQASRRSIREVVQYIEEKFRPRQPAPVEVKRREPSALIRQRLQSLKDSASYRQRLSNRSVSEDRGRDRERTPDSPRLHRRETRGRSGNQFMHRSRALPEPAASVNPREAEQAIERERKAVAKRERELLAAAKREKDLLAGRERDMAARRERELAADRELEAAVVREREFTRRVTDPGRARSVDRMEDGGSSGVSAVGSMDRLDQLTPDVDNLVIMRGWVRSLINKFQQIT
ncbi:uncharacterized protein [Littorina saxatilis]|uniref:Uncharacterized protein n=1 Tax=Littorina saxatilis TaxID=31220 RepID=A0AAN9GDD5_9CAEN